MKKILSSALVAAMLLSSASAFAMNAKQEGKRTVILEGNVGEANALVAVDVYVNGKSKADLDEIKKNDGKLLDALKARLQTKSDENGEFSVSFDMTDMTGKYTAYVGTLNGELEPYTFAFVNDDEYQEISGKLDEMESSDIKEIIDDPNKNAILGLTEEQTNNIDSENLSNVIKNTLEESEVDKTDRDKVWAEIDRAYYVAQLNEGKAEDVTKADDELTNLSSSDVAPWLDKDFVTDEVIDNFNDRLSNNNFGSVSEYEDSLTESFVLAVVNNPTGAADVKEIVTAFKDDIGVNASKNTPDSVWNKLAGNDYKSFDDLKKAFNEYVDDGNSIGSSSSSNSFSSSSSSSSNKKPAISGETIATITPVTPITVSFNDLGSVAWAEEAIIALAKKNIVNGVGNGQYNPNGLVTREQFAKIVVGAFLSNQKAAEIDFTDVEKGAWYYDYIATAFGAGVVNGMGDGTFGVGLNITRQDMCVMIYKAALVAGVEFDANADEIFADDAQIADYAKEAVYALKNKGAVSGMDEYNFAPTETATRAQAAKIIYSLIG